MKSVLAIFTALMMALILSFPSGQIEAVQTQPVSVLTNRYNNARTGANLNETILNTSNVDGNQFGKLFSREVEGHIYAQPLYVPNVEIPGQGTHNVIYVATMHNMVYAFDADDPALSAPLWQVSLGTPFTQNILSDIPGGEDGILSTPVIDPETQTIYLVSRNWENEQAVYKIHALDITTGEPKFGSPADIHLSIQGTGSGNVNGVITLDASNQLQRTGLLLSNGNIYFGFSANNDQGLWFGWLAAYSAANVQEQTGVFNVSPSGHNGGIWMGGSGIATDGTYLYLAAGNGTYDADTGGTDHANSALKLQHSGSTISIEDYFTPFNWPDLNEVDADMGSTGVVLIPDTSLLVVGAKDGNLYVLDQNQFGGYNPDANQNLQVFSLGNGRTYCTPVFWGNGPNNLPTLYGWNELDAFKAFNLDVGAQRFNPEPASVSALLAVGVPVGSLALSANGTDPATGILWATFAPSADTGNHDGVLVAVSATDLNAILWHSEMNPDRDSLGLLAKFNPVTVANGKVYAASFSNRLNVYGLLPA